MPGEGLWRSMFDDCFEIDVSQELDGSNSVEAR
jgi:hypothetical protein